MLDRLREIERELGVTPIVSRTAATTGIPTLDDGASGDVTKVLPASVTGPAAIIGDADNATLLRRRTKNRSRRGGWILAIVLLLAALAGGIGWWLGSGPGSLVAVPDVANLSFAEAQARLAEDSLLAVAAGRATTSTSQPGPSSARIRPAGLSASTRTRRSTCWSRRDRSPRRCPPLAGAAAADARGDPAGDQSDRRRPGSGVLHGCARPAPSSRSRSRRGPVATPWTARRAATAFEGDTATLSVSAGPLPDVYGESVESATAILAEKNLSVSGTREEFRDDLEAGLVVYIVEREGGGSWSPGDSVTLAVSKGPEPIEVPNVVGLTRDEAKAAITDAGFTSEYNAFWDVLLDDRDRGRGAGPRRPASSPRRGSTISLRITGSSDSCPADARASRAPRRRGTPAPGSACGSGAGRRGARTASRASSRRSSRSRRGTR